MNAKQRQQAAAEAQTRIANGADPQGLVHVLYYPADAGYGDEIQGLSTALPADADLSGYTSRYYTLAEMAA